MRKRVFLALLLIASLMSLFWLASSRSTASKTLTKAEPSTTPSMPSKKVVYAKLANLERGWVKNEGQWDEGAIFSAPGYFGTTWIAKDGQLLHVAVKGKESWVISERWVGGKVQAITPEEELPTKVSYFIGNDPSKHRSNLPTYRYVSLGEVWSGVEVKLKATQKTVEKLFYVQPGADPSKIVVEVDGAKGLKLSKDGEIIIQTGLGELKLSKPVAWQEKDGKKLPVEVSYKLVGKNRYSFVVAKADPSLPIVIDPTLQAIYLGGSNNDFVQALAIHTGEVYVLGETFSNDFPGTSGRTSSRTDRDVFLTKLDSNLNLLQSIYLGGSGNDFAGNLAILGSNVYVTGSTFSNDFPGTSGRTSSRTDQDAFVAKLDSNLNLLQSIYLGGSRNDSARALAISGSNVYVAGFTLSNDFPGTSGRTSSRTDQDAFVAKLDSNLNPLQSIYLGGSDNDFAEVIAISGSDVYVTGETFSNDFPGTSGRASSRTDRDAFVAKLDSNLNPLQSIYLGGSGNDFVRALAISGSNVYVAGFTLSNDFPYVRDPSRTDRDAFVAKLNSSLNLLESVNLAGSRDDSAFALAIHPRTGKVYVTGGTNSNDFLGGARDSARTDQDAFLVILNSSLNLLDSVNLAGSRDDSAFALAIHPTTGDVYVAGSTLSNDFLGVTRSGTDRDVFVVKLSADLTGDGSGDSGGSGGGGGSDTGSGSGTGGGGSGGSGGGSGGSDSGSGSGSGGGSGSGVSDGSGGGSGSGSGSGGSGIGTGGGGSGGGCSMTGSTSSMAGLWNILVWLSVPAFVVARRIRKK
jgi:hypothetical protein